LWAWGSIEADFKRYYDIDLNAVAFENKMSWRSFCILLRGLPDDSAWIRFVRDKQNRNLVDISSVSLIDTNISALGNKRGKEGAERATHSRASNSTPNA